MNSKGNVPSAAKPVKDLGGLMRWRKYVKCLSKALRVFHTCFGYRYRSGQASQTDLGTN